MTSDESSNLVVSVGDEVSEMSDEERQAAIEARRQKLDAVLNAWRNESEGDRKMRRNYAYGLMVGLFIQGAVVNVAFFLIGTGYLNVDEWTSRTFIIAVFGELASMVFFIVKYLFSPADQGVLRLIEKL